MSRKCPECGRRAWEKSREEDDEYIYRKLYCGHILTTPKVKPESINIRSNSGQELFPFQKENVAHFARGEGRLCIFDEMGLGKTVSAIGIAITYKLKPVLVICKSGIRYQWKHMIEDWAGEMDELLQIPICKVQVIEKSNSKIHGKPDYVIVSYDLLPRLSKDFFNGIDFQLAIVDECQQIKNTETKRTKAVTKIVENIPHTVFTSGTPIKNNAIEFYPTLHICDPYRFYSKVRFAKEFVNTYLRGQYLKYGGLKDYKYFHQVTKDYIIRHTQEEVLPQLPSVRRNFLYVPLNGSEEEYNREVDSFVEYYYSESKRGFVFFQNVLAYFSRMRKLTGHAKISHTFEFVTEFLESTERKIAVFAHHIEVRERLVALINDWLAERGMKPVLELVASMEGEASERVKSLFNFNPEYRILVASTLASGEGHNLQHSCSDAVMMERQWNPANEEQAEARFKRPGQKAQVINITYILAEGTIDEYFTKLVEEKRADMKYSLDGERGWNEESIIKELAERLVEISRRARR